MVKSEDANDPFARPPNPDDLPPPRSVHVVGWGVAVATVLYVVSTYLRSSYGWLFWCIPTIAGFVPGVLSRRPYRATAIVLALAMVLSVVTLREGVICLFFALPVLLPMQYLGTWLGKRVRRYLVRREHQRRAIVASMLLWLGFQGAERWWDDPAQHPLERVVSTQLIPAEPEQVFRALTASSFQVEQRYPWFIRIGLPMPRELTLSGRSVGAALAVHFDQGRADGHVTRYEPGRALSFVIERYAIDDLPFHITRLGRGPHYGLRTERVDDWLTLRDIDYRFEAVPGGTQVTRSTVWRRHLSPDLYFGWLQRTVMQRGQDRLLELIAERFRSGSEPTLTDDERRVLARR
ncbi:MAG TPA: hypothetical protein VLC09_05580 [Polyangiaceae bacterium]|nr:hypothetical protein [Polyangiaceae bacterium]